MDRRSLLRLIASGLVGTTLDVDKLLWVPGQKTIFLPPVIHRLTISEIIAMEMERIRPRLADLFQRDDLFYTMIESRNQSVTGRAMRVPLVVKPGER